MHTHSDILTGTHACYITHTKKAKTRNSYESHVCFFLMLCITVGLSHIVTLISIFSAISARFLLFVVVVVTFVRCAKRAQTININNVFFVCTTRIIFIGRTQKRSFFISTQNKHAFKLEKEKEEESLLHFRSTEQTESNRDRDHLTFWFIKWFRNFCCCCLLMM